MNCLHSVSQYKVDLRTHICVFPGHSLVTSWIHILKLSGRPGDFSNLKFCQPNCHLVFSTRMFQYHPQFHIFKLILTLSPLPTWNNLLLAFLTLTEASFSFPGLKSIILTNLVQVQILGHLFFTIPLPITQSCSCLISPGAHNASHSLFATKFLLLAILPHSWVVRISFTLSPGPTSKLKSFVVLR